MEQFISYAQNREDAILAAYFRDVDKGYYVDIGANDPSMDSVTKSFYEKGWRGISVEPNPKLLAKIKAERPEDINIQAAVSDKSGELKLRVYKNSGLSTSSLSMQKYYGGQPKGGYKDIIVETMTLNDIFNQVKPDHIHFMKIDVEGLEYEVLSGNDWKLYRPEILCIEANHTFKDWKPILRKNGYSLVWNDGLNDYYLATESESRRTNFSYAEDMLVDRLVTPSHIHSKVTELASEVDAAKRENQTLKLKVDRLTDENKELQDQIAKERRLRYAARNLVVGLDKAILAQIERFNQTSARGKDIRYEQLDYKAANPREYLNKIAQADLLAHYSRRKTARPKKRLAYKPLRTAYMIPRRVAAVSLKSAVRLVKGRKS